MRGALWPKYGVRYPSGTVHECPFGEGQAMQIAVGARRYLDHVSVMRKITPEDRWERVLAL